MKKMVLTIIVGMALAISAEASCQGKLKGGSTHGQSVYKCDHCGAVDCENNECSNMNFYGSKCHKCGKQSPKKTKVS